MPVFASLTRSGPVRKNELLRLLWCAEVRMYNNIHWTARAPLISAWKYFAAEGACLLPQKLYICKTAWRCGQALRSTWITPLRQDKQYSHAKMSWLYLRFQCGSPFVPFVPFISVTFGRVHADRLIATVFHPPIIMQDHNNNTNHRRL